VLHQHDAPHRVRLHFGGCKALRLERARIGDVGGKIQVERRALPDLCLEFARRAVDGFHTVGGMRFAEQHDDLVQSELEIGGGGDRDLLARLRGLPDCKQANKNQQPCYKTG